MPGINGKFYANPLYGRALERARMAEAGHIWSEDYPELEPQYAWQQDLASDEHNAEAASQDRERRDGAHWVTIGHRHVLIDEAHASRAKQDQQPTKVCPSVPAHPSDVNIDDNIRLVQKKLAKAKAADAAEGRIGRIGGNHAAVEAWFVNKVRPRGDWDYKLHHPKGAYDAFGNFNFGATGSVLWNEDTLLRGAGALKALESGGKFGVPWKGPNYGNQSDKNDEIRKGIQYYLNHCGDF